MVWEQIGTQQERKECFSTDGINCKEMELRKHSRENKIKNKNLKNKFKKMHQTISLIAAVGKNLVIGNENKLIWKIPNDLKRFRELTSGKSVIMGRKTFESIGKPLPNRKNIIITRDKNYSAQGCIVVHSAKEAINFAGEGEVMVIGGAQIYKLFLPTASKMYLTLVDKNFDGDAYFPRWKDSEWKITFEENHDEEFKYSFVNFERK